MTESTRKRLGMVTNTADGQGYVGEAWGTLQGDKIREMRGPCRWLNYATRAWCYSWSML